MKNLFAFAKSLLVIVMLGLSSNVSIGASFNPKNATGNTKERITTLIDWHLQETQSGVYLNKCNVSDYYYEGDVVIVRGSFYHQGVLGATWKNFVARINTNTNKIRLGYWKYWVLVGEWSLITTDGYPGIYPVPDKY